MDVRAAEDKVGELEAASAKLLDQIREMETANQGQRHVLYHNLACIYRQGGRFAEAESAFLESLRIDNAAPDTHLGLGLLYEENLGQPEKALACYARFLELAPDSPHAAGVRARLGGLGKQKERDGVNK